MEKAAEIFCGFCLFKIIYIVGAFAADKLRTGARRQQARLPDRGRVQPYRHRHFLEVHSDEGPPDVQPRVRADVFHRHRRVHPLIDRCGKGAASLRHRADVYRLVPPCRRHRFFHDERAVKVLAALRRERNAFRCENRQDAVRDRAGNVHARMGADFFAADFAGRTADHQQIAGGKMRLFDQLDRRGRGRLPDRAKNRRIVLFVYIHDDSLLFGRPVAADFIINHYKAKIHRFFKKTVLDIPSLFVYH